MKGDLSHLTLLYWASNYDPQLVFYNYPDLTRLQRNVLIAMFNNINDFKSDKSDGNVFPILP